MKRFFKILLRILLGTTGALSILVGVASLYGVYRDYEKDGFGLSLLLVAALVFLPVAFGYILFRLAAIEELSMKQFCGIVLRTLGTLSVVLGFAAAYGVYHDFGKNGLGLSLLFVATLVVFPAALGYLLFLPAAKEEWGWKLFWRILLRTLGSLSILAALALTYNFTTDAGKSDAGFSIFYLCTVVFLPAAFGYLLFQFAADEEDTSISVLRSRVHLRRLGLGMALLFVVAIAFFLPMAGRVIMVILLLLVFTRMHRGWSSREVKTPFGRLSWADVFDFVVRGLLVTLVEVVIALITGGRSLGFTGGGGGKSGGGGASGSW